MNSSTNTTGLVLATCLTGCSFMGLFDREPPMDPAMGGCTSERCTAELATGDRCVVGACAPDGACVEALLDFDGDGHADSTCTGYLRFDVPADDCDDGNSAVFPGATEVCNNVDDDCSSGGGVVDEDADDDGFGDEDGCVPGEGAGAFSSGDCMDTDAQVHPGALERCNGIDDDCDGPTDEGSAAQDDCAAQNAQTSCVAGACVLDGCTAPFGDCDGMAETGCEVELTSLSDCGRCGEDCGAANACVDRACVTFPVEQISIGQSAGCVTRQNGRVACWGDNNVGQLGDGGATTDSTEFVTVVGLADVAEVRVGDTHVCARTEADGRVYCWGRSDDGALGTGMAQSSTPMELTGLRDASQLSCGRYHCCTVLSGGNVTCWGKNNRGQLGDGTFADRDRPVASGLLSPATWVAADYLSSCALDPTGTAACLGEEIQYNRVTGAFAQMAITEDNLCARTSGGSVRCSGETVIAVEHDFLNPPYVAFDVEGSAAMPIACAVRDTGELECAAPNQVDRPMITVPGVTDATDVSLALRPDGVMLRACVVLGGTSVGCLDPRGGGITMVDGL